MNQSDGAGIARSCVDRPVSEDRVSHLALRSTTVLPSEVLLSFWSLIPGEWVAMSEQFLDACSPHLASAPGSTLPSPRSADAVVAAISIVQGPALLPGGRRGSLTLFSTRVADGPSPPSRNSMGTRFPSVVLAGFQGCRVAPCLLVLSRRVRHAVTRDRVDLHTTLAALSG